MRMIRPHALHPGGSDHDQCTDCDQTGQRLAGYRRFSAIQRARMPLAMVESMVPNPKPIMMTTPVRGDSVLATSNNMLETSPQTAANANRVPP